MSLTRPGLLTAALLFAGYQAGSVRAADGAVGGGTAGSVDVSERIPGIVEAVAPSVVGVLTNVAEGSGVVWGHAGHVVTSAHIIVGACRVELLLTDGTRQRAEVVGIDPLTDIALLRAEHSDLRPATFASDLPSVGGLAIAVGNPPGFRNTVTVGVISGVRRAVPAAATLMPVLAGLIQTDAAISPGNSGGALIDAAGRVVGINVAYMPPDSEVSAVGLAVPSATVAEVVTSLAERSVRNAAAATTHCPASDEHP